MSPDPNFRPRTRLTDAAEVSKHHRAASATQRSGVGCGWPLLTRVVVSVACQRWAGHGERRALTARDRVHGMAEGRAGTSAKGDAGRLRAGMSTCTRPASSTSTPDQPAGPATPEGHRHRRDGSGAGAGAGHDPANLLAATDRTARKGWERGSAPASTGAADRRVHPDTRHLHWVGPRSWRIAAQVDPRLAAAEKAKDGHIT
jgi:hypothetical protein